MVPLDCLSQNQVQFSFGGKGGDPTDRLSVEVIPTPWCRQDSNFINDEFQQTMMTPSCSP